MNDELTMVDSEKVNISGYNLSSSEIGLLERPSNVTNLSKPIVFGDYIDKCNIL